METDAGAEHESVQDLSGELSVSEDQVPPVGQQTEIGEEEEEEEEDEMVSSMSVLCEPESNISVTTEEGVLSSTVSMSVSSGSHSTVKDESSWDGPDGSQVVQNTTGTYYTHPDSVQQEETVTTLSEQTAEAPSLGNADSSVVATGKDTVPAAGGGGEWGVGGESGSGTGDGGGGEGGVVQSEGNYDSSYSYAAGTEASQYGSYQDGYQYQYSSNYSQSQPSAQETHDANQSSAYSKTEDQSYHSAGVGSGSDGHWSGQEHWGKNQGQQWHGQEQDGYWQGQEWHGYSQGQEWQGQGGHEHSWQGYDGQGQQWQRQEGQGSEEVVVQGQEKDGQRQSQEQHWQSQGGQGYEGQSYEGSTQEQQWQGQGSSSTGSQYNQSQYYAHSQQQYEGDTKTSSTEQQYYDQSAYYGQEGYGNEGSQHQHGYSGQSSASSHMEYQQGDYTAHSHQGSHSTTSQQGSYSQESQPDEYGQYHGYDQQAYSEQAPARGSQGSSYDYGALSRHSGEAAQWSSGYQDQQSHSQPAAQNYDAHQGQYGWSKESQQQQSGDYGGQGYSEGYQHQYHSTDHTQGASSWGSGVPEGGSSYYHQYSEQPPQHHSQGGYSQDSGYHTWQEQPYQQQYPQEQQYGPQQHGSGYRPPPFQHRPPHSEHPAHPSMYHHQGPPRGPPQGPPPPNYPPPHQSIPPPHHLPLPQPPSSRFPSQPYVHTREFSPPPWHQRESWWQKWKHHKTSPLGRSPYSSPTAAVSSPANSVSSDISSTSHDSPTSIPAAAGSPVADSSEQGPEKSPTTPKSVFSQQLRDPRQSLSSANKSYLKNAKYASATSSLVHKRNAMLKQPGWKSKASVHSKGPPVIDPHHVTSETSTKESKSKVQAGEPTSFPKGSLTGFKIPKHSKASEQSKPHPTQQNRSPVRQPRAREGGSEVRKGRGTDSEIRKPVAVEEAEARSGAEEDLAVAEQGMATEAPAEEVDNQPTSTVLEKPASPEAPHPSPQVKIEDASDQQSTSEAERKEDDENIPPKEERESDSSSQPVDREKPHDNLISLFKTMDTSTLYALASTIQLAMTSASSQLVSKGACVGMLMHRHRTQFQVKVGENAHHHRLKPRSKPGNMLIHYI